MSMLSAQCDELRKLAGDGSMEWVAGPIRTSILLRAADTINELRDSVHRERAEADRLREERNGWKKLCADQEVMHVRREETLDNENSKLRELVRNMWFGLYCPMEPTEACPQCMFNRDGECFFERRMNELGIEVD